MTQRFSFHDRALTIVGILNVTPDSFSDGGRFVDLATAVRHAEQMVGDGAHLVDIGGESTRPNAADVDTATELQRVLPVVTELARRGVPVSIDTRRPAVAEACLDAGACVVNDVGGLRDSAMVNLVAAAQVPVVVMHTPAPDLASTHAFGGYVDVVADVALFLRVQAAMAAAKGIVETVLDPGLGFGKSVRDNVQIIRQLDALTTIAPVLVGASRKRFIGTISGVPDAADRDPATIAVHLRCVINGAAALRVHDVAGHVQAINAWQAIDRAEYR